MKPRVLGVIPARMNSTRFPGKPLANILNKPMIQWVYENSSKAKLLDDLIVATDSIKIYETVINFGGKSILTREDHDTGLDRVIEVSEKMTEFDYFVNIQGDEPAIQFETINGVIEVLFNSKGEVSTAAIPFKKIENFLSPHQVKVIFNNSQKALYFSRLPIPYSENKDLSSSFKHLGIYGYEKKALEKIKNLPSGKLEKLEKLEQLRLLENNMDIYVFITKFDSVGVDTPDDILRAEEALKNL